MAPERITSKQNPKVREIRKLLRQKKARLRQRAFVVEGTQAALFARQFRWTFRFLVYVPEQVRSPVGRALVLETPERLRLPVAPAVYRTLSERDNPPELIAVVEMPPAELSRIPIDPQPLLLLLDRIRDPGNLGTIVRSADALGAQGVVLFGDAVDPYHPQTVRASMGSLFAVPVVPLDSWEELNGWVASLRRRLPALQVVATVPRNAPPLESLDGRRPTLLAVGNEQKGLAPEVMSLCDKTVTIPMVGAAESLNTAVAASIALYEIARQRRGIAPADRSSSSPQADGTESASP